MRLYSAPYAPNPRRVTMFIAEKGITDIEIVSLDLQAGEHRTPEFKAKSPLSQIPTLELDDGRSLTESRAICTYLEAVYPDPPLMGRDAFERAEVEMWDRRVELMITMPIMMWMRHGMPVMARLEKNQNAGVAESNQATAMRMVKWFDAQLADCAFIAGDRLTIADLTALAGLDFAKMAKWRPDDCTPHLKRWRDMMAERPAGKVAP
ncbi:MAG: glutathione S-transferase [Alphaproteobacteria bacterium]|nr:MAG: glutathione S-transferase [Caulobacteraceae bacterium]TPW02081.1 MAG: glutathione S-transferase [Alphaproteobacteria bacterium]